MRPSGARMISVRVISGFGDEVHGSGRGFLSRLQVLTALLPCRARERESKKKPGAHRRSRQTHGALCPARPYPRRCLRGKMAVRPTRSSVHLSMRLLRWVAPTRTELFSIYDVKVAARQRKGCRMYRFVPMAGHGLSGADEGLSRMVAAFGVEERGPRGFIRSWAA